MAMEGLRPIAEIQFADFIYPSFNQIVGEAAKIRYRSNGEYTCPMVIRTPYGGGVRGALSHSVSVEALFYHVPGLKIVAPSFPADVKGLLNAAIDDPDPVLFLEHKKTYRLIKGEVPDGHYTIPLGKANVLKEGAQLTVVSYGLYVHWALEAAKQLEQDGISVEVIDLRSIRPMDKTTILASVEKTRKLLIVHEDNKFGGIGAEISAMVAEEALFNLDAPSPAALRTRRAGDGLRAAARGRVHVVAGANGRRDAGDGALLMATTITMPQLGETVTEGTVAQWLKSVGDSVDKYEDFVEVSTDKVNAGVPSPVTGTIRELLVKEGETVATGTPIAVIDEVGAAPAAPEAPPAARPEPVVTPPSSNGAQAGTAESAEAERAARGASPAVRRLAREHHVDIRTIKGSGANGRVTADDILAAARGGAVAPPPVAPPPAAAPVAPGAARTSTYAQPIPGTLVQLTQARRIIAERMVESKHTAPHAWSMVEIDVTDVWKWRSREKDRFERETGYKLTLLPFFIRAVVQSLATFPLMNARFVPATDSSQAGIYVNDEVNVGIAIGLPTNLVVPVIKHADKLSIKGLAIAGGELIEKARKGKLGVDELAGGTFTVNNNGANGSWASAPIIAGGQAGIVTMEAVVKKLVVRDDDTIAIRHMMNSCLSLDHRVVDGYVASGFLADLKRRLEAMGPQGEL